MVTHMLLMTLALAAGQASGSSSRGQDPVIEICRVASIEDQSVPGADPGVLVKLNVREGSRVTKDMEVARVDDREAQAAVVVKQLDYEVAEQEAKSDITIRAAEAASAVAQQAYLKLEEANRGTAKTVTMIDILRAKLEWEKARLSIEKEREQNLIQKLTAKAKLAEVEAAQVSVNRRILRAPFDGVVVMVSRREGEWVAPGEPVVQVVRIDRLRVSGNLDATKWTAADIENRNVTVEVALPGGRAEKVQGKVVYVSPVVETGQVLPVWAEIDTPMVNGLPTIAAGMLAKMTIHVSQPAQAPAHPVAAPRKPPVRNTSQR